MNKVAIMSVLVGAIGCAPLNGEVGEESTEASLSAGQSQGPAAHPEPEYFPAGATSVSWDVEFEDPISQFEASVTGLFNGKLSKEEVCAKFKAFLSNPLIPSSWATGACSLAQNKLWELCGLIAMRMPAKIEPSPDRPGCFVVTKWRGYAKGESVPTDPDKFEEMCKGLPDFSTVGWYDKDGPHLEVSFSMPFDEDAICAFSPVKELWCPEPGAAITGAHGDRETTETSAPGAVGSLLVSQRVNGI